MPKGYKHFSKTKPIKTEHLNPAREWWANRTEIADKRDNEDSEITYKAKNYSVQEMADRNYDIDLCKFPQEEKTILSPEETIDNFISRRESLEADIDAKLKELKKLLEIK